MLRYPDAPPPSKERLEWQKKIAAFVARQEAAKNSESPPEKVQKRPLSEFEELAAIIDREGPSFIRVGDALAKIRDKKLYLGEGYASFQECYEKRFGFKKAHVYRLIDASEEALALPEPKRPKTEWESRKSQKIKAKSPAGDFQRKTVPDFEKTLRNIMPETDTAPEEEDLCDENVARIRRAKNNRNFQKALKEWLDESRI